MQQSSDGILHTYTNLLLPCHLSLPPLRLPPLCLLSLSFLSPPLLFSSFFPPSLLSFLSPSSLPPPLPLSLLSFLPPSFSPSFPPSQEMCVKYWPVEVGQPEVFGAYQVELSDDEREVGDYITRKFKLSPIDKVCENSTQFSVAACNRHCKYHLGNNRHALYTL